MRVLGAIAFVVYFAAWWLVFWLPMRKRDSVRFLVFIPAAVCSIGVPSAVSDVLRSTPTAFLVVWFAVPILLIAGMLVAKKKPRRDAGGKPLHRRH